MPIKYVAMDEALAEGLNVASENKGAVAIFSYEMSYAEISKRLLALKTGIPLENISRLNGSQRDLTLISKAVTTLSKELIFINDQAKLSMSEMIKYVEQLNSKYGCELVILHGMEEFEGLLIDKFETDQIIIVLSN